ncbi:hypothetical protein E4H12_10365 [Candidatus Thorarchaeota archaeon]|nr:MAG: hypothetical protein E4H12_10365 [Candidatus Thorarchaeota archaeon]
MQTTLSILSYLGLAVLLLVVSELMVKRLIRGLESALDFFFEKREKTLSFSLFNRSEFLWRTIFVTLWFLSGIFVSISILESFDADVAMLFMIWFYFMGDLRLGRSMKYIQQINSRITWTTNWSKFELYRSLIETENPAFIEILNDSEKLKQIERTAHYVRNAVMFDPKEMRNLESREEIEPRLRNNLEFLMSESSSVIYSLEEIYVILFILSEKADRLGKIVEDILVNEEKLQLLLD